MSEGVKPVIWVRLLPDELKGGPQSKFQRELRARKAAAMQAPAPVLPSFRDTTPIGMAEGGSPHTVKFQNLAEKLKKQGRGKSAFPIAMHALGYEGSIKPGHRRKPGYDAGGYTGDSGDHIEADRVANEKTFVDHEGEFYVNAPMTGILGGPDAVEAIMLEAAKKRIASAEAGAPQIRDTKPIMSAGDAGHSYAPISEIRSSFALGGAPTLDPNQQDKNLSTSMSDSDKMALQSANIAKRTEPVPTDAAGLGKITDTSAGDAAAPGSVAGLSTTGAPATGGQNLINSATKYYQGIMSGDDPYYKSLVESTLQKQGASAGAGKAALQQRLAQQGIVGTAAEAAMASYDRSSRENAAGIQTGLAQQELGQQAGAASQLAGIGSQEKAFDYQKNVTAMTTALQAGDIKGFASAASSAFGINIDITQLKTKQDLENLNSAYTTLNQLNTQFGNNWNTDTAGAKNALQLLYTSTGGKGDMPADWASNQISSIQRAADPLVQAASSLTPEDANLLFGNTSNYVGANGEVGIEGVKADWAKLITTGGLTMNKADGTFSVDPSKDPNGLLSKMFGGGASGVVAQIPAGTAVGGTFSDGGTAYTVSKADGSGKPTEVTSGGVAYSVTAGKGGTSVLKKISDSTGITPVANGNTTEVYFGGQQLQFNDPVTGTLTNVTQTTPSVYMVGNSHVAIDGTTGKVNLTGINADANGNATYSDGKGTTTPITAPDNSAVKMDAGSTQYGKSANGQRVVVGASGSASVYGYSNWQAQYGSASADIQNGKDSLAALNDAVNSGDLTTAPAASAKLKELVDGLGTTKLSDITTDGATLAQWIKWHDDLISGKSPSGSRAGLVANVERADAAIAKAQKAQYDAAKARLVAAGVTNYDAWLSNYGNSFNYNPA